MKSNRLFSILGISFALLSTNCEDPVADNVNQNCAEVVSFFINDDNEDTDPFLDEQLIIQCSTSEAGLQNILDNIEAENTRLQELFNVPAPPPLPPVDEEPMEPLVVVPTGQPAAPTNGFTLTFDDEMVDFSFGEGGDAATFSNDESTIIAEVTAGDEPAEPSDAALKVDLTPSNTSGGFYFAGTVLDIDELGSPNIDFTGSSKLITANVFSTVPFRFRVQVSNAEGEGEERMNVASPAPGFKEASHGGSGWEQISIDFSSGVTTVFAVDGITGGQPQTLPLDGMYNTLQFQFEALPLDVLSTLFVDNVNYNQESGVVIIEPVEPMEPVGNGVVIEFDEMGNDYSVGEGNDSTFAFSNGESSIAVSVATSNIPTDGNRTGSGNAIQVDLTPSNTSGGFYFAGLGYDLTDYPFDEIDFTGAEKSITVNVWSNVAFGFRVQVSDTAGEAGDRSNVADPTPGFKDGAHTGSGWEEITIDFTSGVNTIFGVEGITGGQTQTQELNGEYSRVQFQLEQLPLDVQSTIYIDNVRYN